MNDLTIDAADETERICRFIDENKGYYNNGLIAVSAGVDSTVVAYLLSEVFGKENTLGLFMPAPSTAPETHELMKQLVSADKFTLTTIDLGTVFEAIPEYGASLESWHKHLATDGEVTDWAKILKGEYADCAEYAHHIYLVHYMRAAFGWAEARRRNALFATAGNRSEYLTGLSHNGGIDSTGQIQPIIHLYKTQVWQLAQYLGVPEGIARRAPTGDMAGFNDEQELGAPFHLLDQILHCYVDLGMDRSQIRVSDESTVERVTGLHDLSHGHRQPPLSLSPRW